ncbi:MAG: hypothetical protein C0434_11025 [Xanthomonadaceae bacterium]|nr:hypothetical protein [Xanthomonadaceae bacterium]
MIVASRAGGNGIPDRPARSIKSGIAIRRAGRPTGDRTAGNHSANHSANHDQGLHDGHRFRPEPGTEGASSRGAARTGVMRAAFDVAVDFARRLLGIDSDTVLSPRSGRLSAARAGKLRKEARPGKTNRLIQFTQAVSAWRL